MFMPMAVGCGVADFAIGSARPILAAVSWSAGALGLAGSVLHLGQPRRAWRIFLGLRRSWLSREAVVFGLWFALATVHLANRAGWLGAPVSHGAGGRSGLGLLTAIAGAAGLFCSVMIYVDTRRQFWSFSHTAPRFFGSAVVLGLTSALVCAGWLSSRPQLAIELGACLALATTAKLMLESHALAALTGDRDIVTPALNTARLLSGPLRGANELRVACGLVGGIIIPVLVALASAPRWTAWIALGFVLAGELLERSLFFRAVDAPKMPGVPA
jgi:DMSO reductase anchor subunit